MDLDPFSWMIFWRNRQRIIDMDVEGRTPDIWVSHLSLKVWLRSPLTVLDNKMKFIPQNTSDTLVDFFIILRFVLGFASFFFCFGWRNCQLIPSYPYQHGHCCYCCCCSAFLHKSPAFEGFIGHWRVWLWRLGSQVKISSIDDEPVMVLGDEHSSKCTLTETNIATENGWLEDEFPFGMAQFQGLC